MNREMCCKRIPHGVVEKTLGWRHAPFDDMCRRFAFHEGPCSPNWDPDPEPEMGDQDLDTIWKEVQCDIRIPLNEMSITDTTDRIEDMEKLMTETEVEQLVVQRDVEQQKEAKGKAKQKSVQKRKMVVGTHSKKMPKTMLDMDKHLDNTEKGYRRHLGEYKQYLMTNLLQGETDRVDLIFDELEKNIFLLNKYWNVNLLQMFSSIDNDEYLSRTLRKVKTFIRSLLIAWGKRPL